MSDDTAVHADRLPTLTEVLELGRETAAGWPAPAALVALPAARPASTPADELVAQVLGLLEPRVGALLEARLREALAPALARAADGLIRDVRAELAPTLSSLVEEAVAQALRQPR
jgi:hypothetical protein